MRVAEVARKLDVSISTVYGLLAAGKLKSCRIGMGRGTYRVTEEQLAEFLRGAEPATPAPPERVSQPRLKHIRH